MPNLIISNDEVVTGEALLKEIENSIVFIPANKQDGETDIQYEERCNADKIEAVIGGVAKTNNGIKIAMALVTKNYYEGGHYARSSAAKFGTLSDNPALALMQIYEANGVTVSYNATSLSQMNTLLTEIIPFVNKFGKKFPQLKQYGSILPIQVYALPFRDDAGLQSTRVVRDVISFYRRKQENGKPGQDDAQLICICLLNANSDPINALMKTATDVDGGEDAADVEKIVVWEKTDKYGTKFFTNTMEEDQAKLLRGKLKTFCDIKMEAKAIQGDEEDDEDTAEQGNLFNEV